MAFIFIRLFDMNGVYSNTAIHNSEHVILGVYKYMIIFEKVLDFYFDMSIINSVRYIHTTTKEFNYEGYEFSRI